MHPYTYTFERAGECLYRNPTSGTYFALVKLKGKQFRQSLKTDNLSEARRKLAEYRRDLERIDPQLNRTSLDTIVDLYLETVAGQARGTLIKKRQIGGLVKSRWKGVQIRSIKKSEILSWLASFKFGANTRNKYLRIVRSIFQLAVDDKVIPFSPLLGVKEEKVPQPIRKTPTVTEFRAIVASIRAQVLSDTADESADFTEFLGLAGLGLAEASSLTWGDIDFERSRIITFRHKTQEGFAIPIYPQVQGLLQKRLIQAKIANGGRLPLPDTKVFMVANAKKAIEAACVRLGLANYTSRSFRRLFITSAIEKGVDVKVISAWQGHKDGGALILKTYSHVRSTHAEKMAKLMTLDMLDRTVESAVA